METIASVLRGELDAPEGEEMAGETVPSGEEGPQRTGRSTDEIRQAQERERLGRAALERAAEDAEARQRLAEQALSRTRTTRYDSGISRVFRARTMLTNCRQTERVSRAHAVSRLSCVATTGRSLQSPLRPTVAGW